jgi:hypothetical protein
MLELNGQAVLRNAGSMSYEEMERIAEKRYRIFERNRSLVEAAEADAEDLREIENLDKTLKKHTPEPKS